MRRTALVKAALVGAAVLLGLAVGTPAWANSTISINSGNVPTTAAGFGTHSCEANLGGGPIAGSDIWVFVLPGLHSTSGDFVSISATFAGHGTVTITAAANPGRFRNGGPQTSKAWIITPSGWTLTGATAVITGTARFFVLTHTCPGRTSPSPSPSTSKSPSTSPSPSHSPSASTSPSHSVSPYPSTSHPTTVTPTPRPYALAGMISGDGAIWGPGMLLIVAGGGFGLMMALRRRRNS